MGLRERLGLDGSTLEERWYVPEPPPRAWVTGPSSTSPSRIGLQPLGEPGFGLRDPDTGEALLVDDPSLQERGVVVADLEGIGERRDTERVRATRPGSVLRLSATGRRVTVYDESGRLDIGYLEEALGAAVSEALRKGADLRALSLWEVNTVDGQRTELKILIVPAHVELVLNVAPGRTIDVTGEPHRIAHHT